MVFPEAALTDYDLDVIDRTAITQESPAVQELVALAEWRGIMLSFGFLERAADGFYVTQALVGPGHRSFHRKCHRTGWELKHCQAGETLEVADIGLAKVGTLICYDSAFPAAAETLVRRGAEILIQPSCHGMSAKDVPPPQRPRAILERKRHIEKYWGARAYDYTCYAIYVNHAGENARGNWFPNYAGFFGPDGEVIAETVTEGEQMVLADLSGSLLADSRKKRVGHYAMMGDARPELYWTAKP